MIDISMILTEAIKVTALGVLGVIGKVIVSYGPKIAKQAAKIVETKMHEKNLDYVLKIGKQAWNQVEEDWRISDSIRSYYNSKANYFDSILMTKIDGLTQKDLDELRQSIAGEYNKHKEGEFYDV